MSDEDLAAQIFARLDAIERHIGMNPRASHAQPDQQRAAPGVDRFGPRRWRGGYDGPNDERPYDRGSDGRRGGGTSDCRFDEKRTVDKIVELVTERLEEMLRILPQLIQIETRPAHEKSGKSDGKQQRPPA